MRSRTSGIVSDRQVQALAEAWLHFTYFATHHGGELKLHLECLCFHRMLNWIAQVITNMLHDGPHYVTQVPDTSCPCKLIEAT